MSSPQVTVTGEPAVQCFCHCDDCRRWGGSIAQAAKLYPIDNVNIEGELITKDPDGKLEASNSWRKSCANCGGVVYDDKSHVGLAMIPAGLSQKAFEPSMHIMYDWKIYSIKDGLPKFKNNPKDFGGYGVTCDE